MNAFSSAYLAETFLILILLGVGTAPFKRTPLNMTISPASVDASYNPKRPPLDQ